jgi:hypothetical protein
MSVKTALFNPRILIMVAAVSLPAATVTAEECYVGTYDGLSIDGTQDVLPDETDETLLPPCAQWETTGSSPALVQYDALANNLRAVRIDDGAHDELRRFNRGTALLSGPYAGNIATLTARLKVDPPAGASEFQGGTLGVFMEIDDGVHKVYMTLLNEDFAGGADPAVGIAGAGPLNQSGTYSDLLTVYWDDGDYHTFQLSRNSDGSATLIVDDDVLNAVNVPTASLQPTSGTPGFSFGAAAGGMSTSYWDSVVWTVGGNGDPTVIPGPCNPGMLPSGALSLICIPDQGWNGQLVVFAHGYVAPDQPLGFHNLTLSDGTPLPAIVQSQGFAFGTTSYRQNGLAILEGADDVRQLVAAFSATYSTPLRTYVAGVSEGGLIATLLAEQSPNTFSSALAACGPIGSFRAQINYIGVSGFCSTTTSPASFPDRRSTSLRA